MKDVTTGTDTRPSRPTHRPLMGVDLAQEIEQLGAEPAWSEHGRTSKTLAKSESFRIVLTLIRAGGELADDDVWSPLTVQVLGGRIAARQADASIEAGSGGLVWFEEGPGWSVRALEDSALLLSVTWPPGRAVEPAFV
jgi:hypothetical protein